MNQSYDTFASSIPHLDTDRPPATPPLAPLYAALAKAQGEFRPIERTRQVKVQPKKRDDGSWPQPYYFDYAPLDEVLSACLPALNANGLALFHRLEKQKGDWLLHTILAHASGASIEMQADIKSADWQGLGSAVTYARRYTTQCILGVAAEYDDDGNEADGNQVVASGARGKSPTPPPRKPEPPPKRPEPPKPEPKPEPAKAKSVPPPAIDPNKHTTVASAEDAAPDPEPEEVELDADELASAEEPKPASDDLRAAIGQAMKDTYAPTKLSKALVNDIAKAAVGTSYEAVKGDHGIALRLMTWLQSDDAKQHALSVNNPAP